MPSRGLLILGVQALLPAKAKLQMFFSVAFVHHPMAKSQVSG